MLRTRRSPTQSATGRGGASATIDPPLTRDSRVPRIGELLLSKKVLGDAQLADMLMAQGTSGIPLGQLLVNEGLVDERLVSEALARQYSLPVIDLRREVPAADATIFVSESIARALRVLPVRRFHDADGVSLEVAVVDPLDDRVRSMLEGLPVSIVSLCVATASDMTHAINLTYRTLSGVSEHVAAFKSASGAPVEVSSASVAQQQTTNDAPVVQVVNKIVTQALRDRASDVHIEPLDDRLRIRYRIDGALNEVLSLPLNMAPALISRIKVLSDMNIVERRRPQDGQFQMTIDGNELDVRVSTTSTIFGEKAVLRLLDKRKSLVKLSELGMSPEASARFRKLATAPFGMLIASGPTGSGKTTTLYATLGEINGAEYNVMTIEDPVEYVFPGINQIQINDQADITFAAGLKSILRQDPDIILVGEMRDVETARIAVQSALTGHLVLSSVHAVDSCSALYRLLDMGIEPFLIASAMVGVVAQRLVRKICTSCKVKYTPKQETLDLYISLGGSPGKVDFFKGEGCPFCSNTGFHERVGVYEVLGVTDDIRQLLIFGTTPKQLRDTAIEQGLRTLQDEAVALVTSDITTMSEVLRTVYAA